MGRREGKEGGEGRRGKREGKEEGEGRRGRKKGKEGRGRRGKERVNGKKIKISLI